MAGRYGVTVGDGGRHRDGRGRSSWKSGRVGRPLLIGAWLVGLAALGPVLIGPGEVAAPPAAPPAVLAGPTTATTPAAAPSRPATPTTTPAARTPTPPPRATATTPVPPATQPVVRADSRTGRATGYVMRHEATCSYPDIAATGAYASVSPAEWKGSAACGTVLEVAGPEGSVLVTVADECPECAPGHVDIAAPAYARIAVPGTDSAPVTYSRVLDPEVGPLRVRVQPDSQADWLGLVPMNTGNAVAAVAVRQGSMWVPLVRNEWAEWELEDGAGKGPFTVRITDDRGHTATVTVPLAPGTTVDTGQRLY